MVELPLIEDPEDSFVSLGDAARLVFERLAGIQKSVPEISEEPTEPVARKADTSEKSGGR